MALHEELLTRQLPEPQRSRWTTYVSSERGDRSGMRRALHEFIRSMGDLTVVQRDDWARQLSEQVADNDELIPVRTPLSRELVLPALIRGVNSGDAGCARWLAHFATQLAAARTNTVDLPPELRTRAGLLRRALQDDPHDTRAAHLLAEELVSQLRYSIHELPAGILWDNHGATADQVAILQQELREFIALVRELNLEAEHTGLIDACEFHFAEYRRHLETRTHATYADHLDAIDRGSDQLSIVSFTVDDDLSRATTGSIEVTLRLSDGTERWCFFITPQTLATVGDQLPDNPDIRIHLGVPHMIVVSDIDHAVISETLDVLEQQGDIYAHTKGLG